MSDGNAPTRSMLPQMESVVRIRNIPIIENSLKISEKLYTQFKKTRLLNWPITSAESVLYSTAELIQPIFGLIQEPISKVDNVLCKTLDFVERKVPSMYLPPEMMYANTKEYMSDHIVKPVVKRANSVKQIGTVASNYAADRIDGAIIVADQYVDKYLPSEDGTEVSVCVAEITDTNDLTKAAYTYQRGKQLSRKLKRRLTQRTIAEAKALKKQINILVYAADLLIKDPKQAIVEMKKLWSYLSADEPENQARPQTLEQLIVLLTRESARKLVHVTNFVFRSVQQIIFGNNKKQN